MREIKFRCYSPVNKEMYYADNTYRFEVYASGVVYYEPQYNSDDLTSFSTEAEKNEPEYIVVMQYTGLKDRNGKEIYEGDILHLNYETIQMTGYVMTKEDGAWIFYKDEDNYLGVHHNKDRVSVIGNLYENPELLK